MSKRILVVDDDPVVRESFGLALEDTTYQVDMAESGEEGVEKARNTKYDLIFLDLKMPGMNGVEALRELRKISLKVSIYVVTAFSKEFFDELTRAEEEGIAFELLQKPIERHRILLAAETVLEGPKAY